MSALREYGVDMRAGICLLAVLLSFNGFADPGAANPSNLQQALDALKPGAELELAPGKYSGHFVLRRSGTEHRPIRIRASGPGVVFSGVGPPVKTGAPCLLLERVSWVHLEGIEANDCWPRFVAISSSRYLVLRKLTVTGGRQAIFAEGDSHHIAALESSWTQNLGIWKNESWESLHHGSQSHFNGAFFGSIDIPGDILIRGNTIRHAFNGVRMIAGDSSKNRNVVIRDNLFEFVRDNPVEPEGFATNWWVFGNHFHQVHAWFSFDGVEASRFLIFGNTGTNTETPCDSQTNHCRGTVLKSDDAKTRRRREVWVFNNSWIQRAPFLARGNFKGLRLWNNAVEFVDGAQWLGEEALDEEINLRGNWSNMAWRNDRSGVKKTAGAVFSGGDFQPAPDVARSRIQVLGWKGDTVGAHSDGQRFRGPTYQRWPKEPSTAWHHSLQSHE